MEDETQDLLNRLFAIASDILERAHEVAASGQSADLDAKTATLYARQLVKAAEDLNSVADTAKLLARAMLPAPAEGD